MESAIYKWDLGPFLQSPETFRVHFMWHSSLWKMYYMKSLISTRDKRAWKINTHPWDSGDVRRAWRAFILTLNSFKHSCEVDWEITQDNPTCYQSRTWCEVIGDRSYQFCLLWKKCYMKCGVWNQMKIWSSHLLDNLSNCLMNLKNTGDSTGFE